MEQNILEGNKVIAEFVGWQHHEDANYDAHEMSKLKYHSSWDALVPAWKKFYDEIIAGNDSFFCDYYTEEAKTDFDCMEYSLLSGNIIAAHKHFLNLINWYNQHKK